MAPWLRSPPAFATNKYLFDYRTVQGLDIEKATRLIVVDTNNWQRLDGMGNLKAKQNLEVLLFDHHGAKGDIKTRRSYCGNTGANITLMLRHLKKIGTSLSPVQSVDMTIQEAFTALKRLGHHGAPVVANKQIVGVLSLRDLRKLHTRSSLDLTDCKHSCF